VSWMLQESDTSAVGRKLYFPLKEEDIEKKIVLVNLLWISK
jgi:hypothetical protein